METLLERGIPIDAVNEYSVAGFVLNRLFAVYGSYEDVAPRRHPDTMTNRGSSSQQRYSSLHSISTKVP